MTVNEVIRDFLNAFEHARRSSRDSDKISGITIVQLVHESRLCRRNSLRRIARHDGTEFSKQSILNDMEKFVKMVNCMDDTVLVPSRLMNLPQEGDDDPFSMFAMLNDLKTELLWSAGDSEEQAEQPLRRVSDLSDTESDASSAAGDSGIDGEDERESAARAAAACRRHLRGLRNSLRQLTAAAHHLTRSYQEEVGAPI